MTVSTELATIPVLKAPGLHPSRHAFALFAELVRDSNDPDGLEGEDEALLYALTGSFWGSSSHILPRSLRRDLGQFREEGEAWPSTYADGARLVEKRINERRMRASETFARLMSKRSDSKPRVRVKAIAERWVA